MTSSRTIHCFKEPRSLTSLGGASPRPHNSRPPVFPRRPCSPPLPPVPFSTPYGSLPRAVSLNTRGDNVVCTIPVSAGNDATRRTTRRRASRIGDVNAPGDSNTRKRTRTHVRTHVLLPRHPCLHFLSETTTTTHEIIGRRVKHAS